MALCFGFSALCSLNAISDFHIFQPEHHWRDINCRNAHLVHQIRTVQVIHVHQFFFPLLYMYTKLDNRILIHEFLTTLTDLAQFHGSLFGFHRLFHSFHFFQISNFFGWRDLILVEMRIWCIKIGIVLVLHCRILTYEILTTEIPDNLISLNLITCTMNIIIFIILEPWLINSWHVSWYLYINSLSLSELLLSTAQSCYFHSSETLSYLPQLIRSFKVVFLYWLWFHMTLLDDGLT
jgi:hypothetical protein